MPDSQLSIEQLWLVAGMVEELRNHGTAIPMEADEIVRDALVNINVATYMASQYPRKLGRLRQIIAGLDIPATAPSAYSEENQFVEKGRLGLFETTSIFEDRVLGVGLKSYPYVIDVDGDGRKDLLVGDHDGFIYVFLNENIDSDPVFGRGHRLKAVDTGEPFVVQLNPKMSFGDLTGNGVPDMVLGNHGGQVAFAPNRAADGSLAFAMSDVSFLQTESGPIDVDNYAYPELVDWDNTGTLDLVVGNIVGKLFLFKNTGKQGEPLFEPGIEIPGIETLMYPCPVFADWNGDGRKDLILGHRDGTIILYANVGDENQPMFERHGLARHADGRPVDIGLLSHQVAVDWNNNSKLDLVVGNDPGQVQVFINVGTTQAPIFDEPHLLRDDGGELIMGVHSVFAISDYNNDGRGDLVVGHQANKLRLFDNVGTKKVPAFDSFREIDDIVLDVDKLAGDDLEARRYWELEGLEFNTEYLGNLAPCPVDWFNRGKLDLLVGHYSGLIYLFENIGTREVPRYGFGRPLQAGGRLLRVAAFSTPVVCDWNNDGRKDLVTGDLLGRLHVFLNMGTDGDPVLDGGFLVEVDGVPVMLGPRSIIDVTDLDGDGRKDVIVGNRFGGVYALMNTGTDADPRFAGIERLQDKSLFWRQLYAGLQHSKHQGLTDLWNAMPAANEPKPMSAVETSCPRVVDYDNDGRLELLLSQRYGRVFVYNELPNPASP